MSKFVLKAHQSNGQAYIPKTILQLMVNLQGLAFSRKPNACDFMNHRDVTFKPLYNAMNNLSKKLLGEGIGAPKNQARVITEEEENELWSKGIMGKSTPSSLQICAKCYFFLLWCFILSSGRC